LLAQRAACHIAQYQTFNVPEYFTEVGGCRVKTSCSKANNEIASEVAAVKPIACISISDLDWVRSEDEMRD